MIMGWFVGKCSKFIMVGILDISSPISSPHGDLELVGSCQKCENQCFLGVEARNRTRNSISNRGCPKKVDTFLFSCIFRAIFRAQVLYMPFYPWKMESKSIYTWPRHGRRARNGARNRARNFGMKKYITSSFTGTKNHSLRFRGYSFT